MLDVRPAAYVVEVSPTNRPTAPVVTGTAIARRHRVSAVFTPGGSFTTQLHHPLGRGRDATAPSTASSQRLPAELRDGEARATPPNRRHLEPDARTGAAWHRPEPATSRTSRRASTTSSTPAARCHGRLCGLLGAHRRPSLPMRIDASSPAKRRPAARSAAVKLTDEFLGLMIDPFVDGRSGDANLAGRRSASPASNERASPRGARAYASVFKAPPIQSPHCSTQRWSIWGTRLSAATTRPMAMPVVGTAPTTSPRPITGLAAGS